MNSHEEQLLKTLSKIKKVYAKKQRKLEKHIRASKVRQHVKQKLKEQSECATGDRQVTDNDERSEKAVRLHVSTGAHISENGGDIRIKRNKTKEEFKDNKGSNDGLTSIHKSKSLKEVDKGGNHGLTSTHQSKSLNEVDEGGNHGLTSTHQSKSLNEVDKGCNHGLTSTHHSKSLNDEPNQISNSGIRNNCYRKEHGCNLEEKIHDTDLEQLRDFDSGQRIKTSINDAGGILKNVHSKSCVINSETESIQQNLVATPKSSENSSSNALVDCDLSNRLQNIVATNKLSENSSSNSLVDRNLSENKLQSDGNGANKNSKDYLNTKRKLSLRKNKVRCKKKEKTGTGDIVTDENIKTVDTHKLTPSDISHCSDVATHKLTPSDISDGSDITQLSQDIFSDSGSSQNSCIESKHKLGNIEINTDENVSSCLPYQSTSNITKLSVAASDITGYIFLGGCKVGLQEKGSESEKLNTEKNHSNLDLINSGPRRKRRGRLSTGKKCLPRSNSPSDYSSATTESSEEYNTLKLIQENYCTNVDRSTRKRNLSNTPLLLSSVFQYFIDDARRNENKEEFSLPIQQYGVLMQNKIPDCQQIEFFDDNRGHNEEDTVDIASSSSNISANTEYTENVNEKENFNTSRCCVTDVQAGCIHQTSFKLPGKDVLVSVDICCVESDNLVVCLCKQSLSLWKQQHQSYRCFRKLCLPQGHMAVECYQLLHSCDYVAYVLKLRSNEGDVSVMVAIFENVEIENGESDGFLPVVNFSSQSTCVCCLEDNKFIIASDACLTKYSIDFHKQQILSTQTCDQATGTLKSLQLVNSLDSALIGLTEDNTVCVWNHITGSLLLELTIGDVWSNPSVLANVFWEEGYIFLSLFSSDSADNAGCLMVVNPETKLYKMLFTYNCSGWKGHQQLFLIENIIGAIDSKNTMYTWDVFSGDQMFTNSSTRCIGHLRDLLVVGKSNCVHVFKLLQ